MLSLSISELKKIRVDKGLPPLSEPVFLLFLVMTGFSLLQEDFIVKTCLSSPSLSYFIVFCMDFVCPLFCDALPSPMVSCLPSFKYSWFVGDSLISRPSISSPSASLRVRYWFLGRACWVWGKKNQYPIRHKWGVAEHLSCQPTDLTCCDSAQRLAQPAGPR